MTPFVTGSPLGPFGDAVLSALLEDSVLADLVGGRIKAAVKESARTPMPYITGSRRSLETGEGGSMGIEGGKGVIWLDFWSEQNGPNEVHQMIARARARLQRQSLAVAGYVMHGGSLVCDEEQVFDDFDPDMPKRSLFRGVLRVSAGFDEQV